MAAGVTNIIPRTVKPGDTIEGPVITITATRNLKKSENGATVIFNAAGSIIAKLPAPFKGAKFYVFVKQAPGSGVGPLVQTKGTAEKIFGKVSPTGAAISEAAGKGVVNTQATSVKGDGGEFTSDGVDWFFKPTGTWAREA